MLFIFLRLLWNDINFRVFFDFGLDIWDLLVVVYDKLNVDLVFLDYLVVNGLFREQNVKFVEIIIVSIFIIIEFLQEYCINCDIVI